MKRYHRQMLLNEVGPEGQKALANSKILIVGAGGLGSPAALYLAASGIGQLSIIDGDTVCESNLHRQIMFSATDVRRNKAEVLAESLQTKSTGQVTAISSFLDETTALELFPQFDVILDGTDNFRSKYLINDVGVFFRKPIIYGAISQFEGRVSIFGGDPEVPCYRCVFPSPPKTEVENCAAAGVLGPLPGMIGCLQAMEALKWILYKKSNSRLLPLIGKMHIFSLADNDFQALSIHQRSECFCKQRNLKIEDLPELPENPSCTNERLSIDYYRQRLIIDVRSVSEWKEYRIPKSLHWPVERFEANDFPKLAADKSYVLVCKSGFRARLALEQLKAKATGSLPDIVAFPGSLYEMD